MADTPVSEFIIDKEMGYSRAEFLYQFKLFAGDLKYTISKNSISVYSTGTTVNTVNTPTSPDSKYQNTSQLIITFSEQADRSIGSLNIPRLLVNFHFTNYTELQHKQFLQKFDLSFQRGGG